ncbi:fructose-specific PTS transporter subunit EIIC [Oscillospiraceae bacterium Marseille-Q3528]|nr:fructose-specific PTS transporter subunit EIIC [Oscillospiraceae bacterium Marseille-Q3528]
MKITELLDKRSISLDAAPASKSEALDLAVELMAAGGKLSDVEAYRRQVYAREEESTTGIGEGIAIPHGKCDAVKKPGLAAMVIRDGVDFDSLDGEPVTLLFLIAAPNTKDNVHLDVLSKLSVLMMDEAFSASLRNAETVEQFLSIIDQADEDQADIDERLAAGTEKNGNTVQTDEASGAAMAEGTDAQAPRLLAVTSCPTGIAHTYMAAEGLEKAARSRGWHIKVETRGSAGAKNVLTEQEIAEADCIIVAADAQVPMDRFDGKRVIECQVSDGISKADELLEQAAAGTVPIYRAAAGSISSSAQKNGKSGSVGHQIYVQLMNGVSHMLPFVVGGGILIAIAFLIDGFSVDMNALPLDQRSNFGSITPVAAWCKNVGGLAFNFMLPVLAGFIAMAIGDRPALAVGFVGGIIAYQGKSGFLGALAAGFLAGYVILGLRKLCSRLPEALEKIAPVLIYPVVGVLVIGLAMSFVVEPVMGTVNMALNQGLSSMGGTNKVILGFVLAAMMAVDMGGPFNKAAYVFGTAAIASGNYDVMAAVMIGGMTPPVAIALATMLFKKKFTKEERDAGPTNFIMGLAFITEGAIPFAASDPVHVLPACLIGSGVAGAMSMLFDCTLMAPHGGIFVFPVMGNPLFYLVALVVGTAISTVLLGVLKKDVES